MKVEKTIYLVRHGQSEANITPVFQSPDSPLSKKGLEQAENIAGRIKNISFEKLISSPFTRAKETAEIIEKATGQAPEFSDLFVERIKPTSTFGKPYSDEKVSTLFKNWEDSLFKTGVRVEDGENFDDIVDRANKALEFLNSQNEKELVLVSHGFFLRVLIAQIIFEQDLTGDILKRFQTKIEMENTGISVIQYGERWDGVKTWRLWIYNDHSHLG